ncbi:MAG: type II secretion system protein [Chthoniobacteraceae bacterium]
MKTPFSFKSAFTLIEMLTVMAVIAVLASLIAGIQAFAQKKAALTRAEAEIRTFSTACESYKAEAGGYPRDLKGDKSASDELDPRVDGDPTNVKYQNASIVLYKALSGDDNADGKASGQLYSEFKPSQLQKTSSGEVKFIKDPFGNAYGYSTAGATIEEQYRDELQKNPAAKRPTGTEIKGFNPTFDLWSTGGVISKTGASGSGDALNAERKRWVKNW